MEFLKVIFLCLVTFYLSKIINFTIKLWQALPIKEEKRSTPIYITKVIE